MADNDYDLESGGLMEVRIVSLSDLVMFNIKGTIIVDIRLNGSTHFIAKT